MSPHATPGASPSPRPPRGLETGTIFSERFRVVGRLASGGVGNVYEAVHIWTTRRVALKMLQPERADNAVLIRRFQIEAEAATRVAHPNVVAVIDMGRDQRTGALYLVQEFLEGHDLYEEMAQRPRLTPAEAMAVMAPVMRALQAAHERGVLHRDLKPENIFLARANGGETVPKVIDFGLARLLTGATRVTEMGVVNGTPAYMSPEQARGDDDLDARTDIWSVGVIWYELLTGRQPFDATQLKALFDSILRDDPPPLTLFAPDVPAAFAQAIHRALAKDRARRFASMGDFLDALTAAGAPAEPKASAPAKPQTAAPLPAVPTPIAKRPSAPMPRSAAIPVVAALLLSPAAWIAGRHRAAQPPAPAAHAAPHRAPVAAPDASVAVAMTPDAAVDAPPDVVTLAQADAAPASPDPRSTSSRTRRRPSRALSRW